MSDVHTILPIVEKWNDDWRHRFEERVAIMMVDAGLPEHEAIKQAYVDSLRVRGRHTSAEGVRFELRVYDVPVC